MTPWLVLQLLATVARADPDPVPLSPAARLALDAVSDPYGFEVAGAAPLGGPADASGYGPWGVAVQLQPRLEGLPVDAVRVVRIDRSGRVRSIGGDPLPVADGRPLARVGGPPLSADQAQALAQALVGGAPIGARLSWQEDRGALRRVWTVERAGAPTPHGPRVPRVRLDAETGRVLSVDDGASDLRGAEPEDPPLALAYLHNPAVDADPKPVKLPLATEALSDDQILAVQQCRDLGETRTSSLPEGPSWDLHVCTLVDAPGPVGGNYLYTPDPWPADPPRDEDEFVAANVYWNVHQGFDWFESRGWVPRDDFDPRTLLVVNYRVTDLWTEQSATDPSQPLAPYRNAYFTGGYEDWEGTWVAPMLVFGQGTETDFGYDADVIHHELGHLVVSSRSGPGGSSNGPYGPSIRGAALNEALADYFSSAIHGDPLVSEYVIGDGTPVRDLGVGATCAASLYGESHNDGLPFSGALWEVRATLLPDDQAALDAVVVASLSLMGRQADFLQATGAIEELAADALDPAIAEALGAAFEARGLHDCPPVTDAAVGPDPFREATVVGGSYWYNAFGPVPAPIQFRIEVPEGGAVVRLSFDQAEYLGFDPFTTPPEPLGVVGRAGDGPIRWLTAEVTVPYTTSYGYPLDVVVDQWTSEGDLLGEVVEISSAPHEENEQYLMRRYELAWTVEAGGPYVFQLTNAHPRSAVAYEPTVLLEPLPAEPEPPAPEPEEPRACGCASGDGGAAGSAALVLLGLILARGVCMNGSDRRHSAGWPGETGRTTPSPAGRGRG